MHFSALVSPEKPYALNPKTKLPLPLARQRPPSVTPELTCQAQFFGDLGAKKLANVDLPPDPEDTGV